MQNAEQAAFCFFVAVILSADGIDRGIVFFAHCRDFFGGLVFLFPHFNRLVLCGKRKAGDGAERIMKDRRCVKVQNGIFDFPIQTWYDKFINRLNTGIDQVNMRTVMLSPSSKTAVHSDLFTVSF